MLAISRSADAAMIVLIADESLVTVVLRRAASLSARRMVACI
ncbi:hypothetical protein [Pseudomonas phage vB_Pae_CF23a]|nr:hypothetical protein Q058_02200 [Pseudomonas aeruginosa BL04]QBI79935.1 hypothetical protein [Pseudomonas phage vB_Pae_CF23a]QBI80112.1 hypothetical protein [Pseudomonas phage vB_Pae_CF65a]QBI80901.1 hypothetical protein [Pseudomonas phage vB_Pae_BR243a]CRX15831.1 hypothetical protein PAERUG_P54_1_London_24_VIM_2_04_13_03056 [Pseudomonas aeruginosa]